MTDIREGLAKPICKLCGLTEQNECNISEGGCVELAECLDGQIAYLRSQGVVRKVEGELPSFNPDLSDSGNILVQFGYNLCKKDMDGYTLTEEIEAEEVKTIPPSRIYID